MVESLDSLCLQRIRSVVCGCFTRPHGFGVIARPFDELESEIVGLATQISRATYRLLRLVAEYDAGGGWRAWGANSMATWLSWQCGIGENAAREQVRVARRLRDFPAIAGGFETGQLSYSKVRAITRVATAETEQVLAETARFATAAQLEQLVAAQRRVFRGEDVRERRRQRYFAWRWDDDGSLVGSFRLPPEEAAILLTALDAERCSGPVPEPQPGNRKVSAETSPGDTRVSAEMSEGDGDDGEWVAPPARCADALVALVQRGAAAKADHLPVRQRLNAVELIIHASAEALARAEDDVDTDPALLTAGLGRPAVRIHPETMRQLTCGCPARLQIDDANGNPLHLGRTERRIRGRLARAVAVRDNGRCRAPGCRRRTTQIHHIRHWARGGPTCIDNLISLCDQHHWLVHEGGWSLAGSQAAGTWEFRRADGRVVTAIRPADEIQFLDPRFTAAVAPATSPAPPVREHLDLDYTLWVVNQTRAAVGLKAG